MNSLAVLIKSAKSISIELPDGPFGRPFDNQYHVISDHQLENDKFYCIELSDDIEITLSGDINVNINKVPGQIFTTVEVQAFDRLVFKVKSKERSYTAGTLVLTLF